MDVVLGVDIGGTGIKFGLVTKRGKILYTDKVKTKAYPKPEKLPEDLKKRIGAVLKEKDLTLRGIGIGTPNGNYFTGTIDNAPNLPWKNLVPLKEYFQNTFNLPVALTNDAKAAALGEMQYGAGKGCKHYIFITLGTGLGSGIIVNGKLVYGYDSLAGELGHIIVHRNGRECGCGRKGCLEQYASATGIVKTYYELLRTKSIDDFRMSLGNMIDAEAIYKKAKAGDEIAIDSFKRTGEILGFALANSVCYTRPEKIFLFGGLAQAGDLLFEPTIQSFNENLLRIYEGKIKILPSGLKESEAAILGAASLIWKEMPRNKKK
ncbi:MAG: ROK family protein [Chitinophagales bacterium]|nr:ROK family protein [Chitinophagales bacterium]